MNTKIIGDETNKIKSNVTVKENSLFCMALKFYLIYNILASIKVLGWPLCYL
jgi:hypothetical protein